MRKKVIVAALVGSIAIIAVYWLIFLRSPNRVTLRNDASTAIRNITLTLGAHPGGDTFLQRNIAVLEPGKSAVFRHARSDLSIRLEFELDGRRRCYGRPYVSQARGEGWLMAFRSNGSVACGYAGMKPAMLMDPAQ